LFRSNPRIYFFIAHIARLSTNRAVVLFSAYQTATSPRRLESHHMITSPSPGQRSSARGMEAAAKKLIGAGAGARAAAEEEKGRRRGHGSTALFVAVDYAFLLAFAGFLSYLVVSQVLPSAA
jgi:hypothetical protein